MRKQIYNSRQTVVTETRPYLAIPIVPNMHQSACDTIVYGFNSSDLFPTMPVHEGAAPKRELPDAAPAKAAKPGKKPRKVASGQKKC